MGREGGAVTSSRVTGVLYIHIGLEAELLVRLRGRSPVEAESFEAFVHLTRPCR